jgi:hypothetical protein
MSQMQTVPVMPVYQQAGAYPQPQQPQQPQQQLQQQQGNQPQVQGGFGRYNGTIDYGPFGQVQLQNYCPTGVFCAELSAIVHIGNKGVTSQTTPSADSNQLMPQIARLSQRLKATAKSLPKNWEERRNLYEIAGNLQNLVSPGTAEVTSTSTQPTQEETETPTAAPKATNEQTRWAFEQIEGVLETQGGNPALKAAMQILQLAMQGGTDNRTAGNRQGKRKHRQQRQSQRS